MFIICLFTIICCLDFGFCLKNSTFVISWLSYAKFSWQFDFHRVFIWLQNCQKFSSHFKSSFIRIEKIFSTLYCSSYLNLAGPLFISVLNCTMLSSLNNHIQKYIHSLCQKMSKYFNRFIKYNISVVFTKRLQFLPEIFLGCPTWKSSSCLNIEMHHQTLVLTILVPTFHFANLSLLQPFLALGFLALLLRYRATIKLLFQYRVFARRRNHV